jgi:hypothetical protein
MKMMSGVLLPSSAIAAICHLESTFERYPGVISRVPFRMVV